jgi:hypothetical protein
MGEAKRRQDTERASREQKALRQKGVCILCGKPAVHSHLMPDAVCQDIKGDERYLMIGSADQAGRTYSQSGAWDSILCADHETMIHDYEEVAIRYMRDFRLTQAERRQKWFQRKAVGTDALIRFACSIMWRFHVSDHVVAEKVWVPEWEAILRIVTFDGDMSAAPHLVVGGYAQDVFPSNRFALPPHRTKFEYCDCWHFVIHGVVFMLKLDRRQFSDRAKVFVINGAHDVTGFVREMQADDYGHIRKIALGMRTKQPLLPVAVRVHKAKIDAT